MIGLSCMAMECIKIGFLCMVIEILMIGLRRMALELNLIGFLSMEMYVIKIGLAGMGSFFNLEVLYGILTAKGKGKTRNVMGLDGMTMAWSVALVVPIQLGKLSCRIFQKVPHLWSMVIGCIFVDRQCEICPMSGAMVGAHNKRGQSLLHALERCNTSPTSTDCAEVA